MTDREKVIKGLECCIANGHNNCPYKSTDKGIDKVTSCTTYLMKDAIAMLKEQEPVKPVLKRKASNAMYNDYVCPICNQEIVYEQKYCCECGRAVKWE